MTATTEYEGFFARAVRPMTADDLRRACIGAGLTLALAATASFPLLFIWPTGGGVHPLGLTGGVAFAVTGALVFLLFVPRLPDDRLMRQGAALAAVTNTTAVFVVGIVTYSGGPRLSFTAIFFTPIPLFAFMFFKRRYAQWASVALVATFAVSLWAQDGPVYPMVQLMIVAAISVGVSIVIGGISTTVEQARDELDALNRRLRRFLAPQVVDVINVDGALAPHRRDIAAFFVDLRGFTSFTNGADPERVVEILGEYYAAVGAIVDRYRGTIGGFDGDGVFAFLGDPAPNPDAADDAVEMAREVATELDRLTPAWSTDLGYGIGLAFGEATVGLVGFEGRLDYSPIGACVNLAARLCADAKHGEIVIDESLKTLADAPRGSVDLKGFGIVETFGVMH